MGTKFQTMLAPIGLSTGDGRRFAEGGITLADVPFSFEWARSREGGHDGAVSVGVVQEAAVLTVKQALADGWVDPADAKGMDSKMSAVWARGELHDAIDREAMPRLAEDVAEAMHLIEAGTLGPSVDLDSFEGVPVLAGTDEPMSWDAYEAYVEEHGEEPKIELLITEGRVRAATLVSIPAFAETSRPLRLSAAEVTEETVAEDTKRAAALIASVATAVRPPVAAFTLPKLTGPTPITWDWDNGRVFGHVATWQTCHVGYADVCVTAPKDETGDYAAFNRFPVETEDGGTVWAGRITVGGRHAGLELDAPRTMAVYDGKAVAAHVRAYSDEHGIVVAGAIELPEDSPQRAALDRRKVSGDWREIGAAGLALVEVLALSPGPRAHAEPGFPIPGTFSHNGRQTALTAALGPEPGQEGLTFVTRGEVDVDALAAALERRQAERTQARKAREELAADLEPFLEAEKIRTEQERAALAEALGQGE